MLNLPAATGPITTPHQAALTLPPGTQAVVSDRTSSRPPPEEGPLAALAPLASTADAVETNPALQAHATIFFTPDGRVLADQIDVLRAYPELTSAAALQSRIAAAADTLASQPGRGVLMLSGSYYSPSNLMQFHAAVDACCKHGWPLLVSIEKSVFDGLLKLVRFLEREPALKQLLGHHTLHSRAGQQIAWNYVRASGDRGALQRLLPEVMACIDVLRSGVKMVHVDKLGLTGGDDAQRETGMALNTRRALPDEGKAVLVLGLANAMPMHVLLDQRGIRCREIAVLDETSNHAPRLYDGAEEDNPTYHTAVTHSHNLQAPVFVRAASQTEAFRMPPHLNPFG